MSRPQPPKWLARSRNPVLSPTRNLRRRSTPILQKRSGAWFSETAFRVDSLGNDVIDIYTDGACSGNPGPGGWGVLLRKDGEETELCGGEPATTNNRMELLAVIEALQWFTQPVKARVYTDSQYVQKG
ncbi:MAG TPA: ribonuclease H, partial [Nitrospira sp.]|nr:ribonuclease H [Nitrospira sp.]